MSNRIRPGLARTLVRLAVLVLACLVRALLPVPVSAPVSDAVRRSPGQRDVVNDAENPVPPPYSPKWRRPIRRATAAAPQWQAPRVRPYLIPHEQRSRREALGLALDGIDVGPRVIHGHRIGRPVTVAPMGVAA